MVKKGVGWSFSEYSLDVDAVICGIGFITHIVSFVVN